MQNGDDTPEEERNLSHALSYSQPTANGSQITQFFYSWFAIWLIWLELNPL